MKQYKIDDKTFILINNELPIIVCKSNLSEGNGNACH